jgi:hypothetical protein
MNRVAATTIPLLVLILSLGRVPLLPEEAAAVVRDEAVEKATWLRSFQNLKRICRFSVSVILGSGID